MTVKARLRWNGNGQAGRIGRRTLELEKERGKRKKEKGKKEKENT